MPVLRHFLRLTVAAWCAALGAFAPLGLWAHGDDQLLIDALTEELAKAPEADLFLRRGELYRHHREWAKAEADLDSAARLQPKMALVDFFRARTRLEAGDPAGAKPNIDRYVAENPAEAQGWFLRGEILAALGDPVGGAADYAEGIRRTRHPRPEYFLRRAQLLAAAPDVDPKRELAAIDEGIAQIGPAISLVEHAITIELNHRNHAGALRRIAGAMEQSPRREGWLVRQGDVLVLCGRPDEAIAAYRSALAEIEALPARYRETVPVEKLARDARSALARLSATTAP